MDGPVPAFFNSPLGAAVGFRAGLVLVSLVVTPLSWWRDCRQRQRRRREEALRQQLRNLEDHIWREARRRLGLPEEES